MKSYLIFMISFMIFTHSVLAKSNRQVINIKLEEQKITLVNQAMRNGERILIISDHKCLNSDICYQGQKIEGMIRVYQKSDKTRYTQFYSLKNQKLEWTMMLMQEWQDYGRIDVFIDRISNHYASAWSAYLPYDCTVHGDYEVPHFDLTEVEELLNTSIAPMSAIFGSNFDVEEIFEGLNIAVTVEQTMDRQVSRNISSLTLASMATGLAVYSLDKGVANTIYGYSENHSTFSTTRYRFKKMRLTDGIYAQRKALKRAQIASELGFDFMSAAMFNIEKSRSACYMVQPKIIYHLL